MSAISCSTPSYGDLMVNRPLPPTAPDAVCALNDLQGRILKLPQESISTHHVLHGGMYARTVRLKPDTVIVGCLYKVPTVLIVHGHAQVFIGDGWAELDGYNVIPASSGRKQVFVALSDVEITMVFATKVKTVEDAEAEMTNDSLLSHVMGENIYTVTGETADSTSSLDALLTELRHKRDGTSNQELRHSYNEACDRLDVLIGMLRRVEVTGE